MDEQQQRRSARRAFIRDHHPDRGGDPAEFAAGLERFDEPARADLRVVIAPARPWPVRWADRLVSRATRRRRKPRVR